jgi:hypothetical protein
VNDEPAAAEGEAGEQPQARGAGYGEALRAETLQDIQASGDKHGDTHEDVPMNTRGTKLTDDQGEDLRGRTASVANREQ